MPLYSKFESYEQPGKVVHDKEVVQAGSVGWWENKMIGGYVLAQCMEGDMGAFIYAAEPELNPSYGVELIACTPEDLKCKLPAGFTYGIEIINSDDERGRLVIQHVMAGGKIQSLN
jgi:hypothetical protein